MINVKIKGKSMFKDLCSIGSNHRLQYIATFHDYSIYNDDKYMLLKGVMLDGIKMLDKLKVNCNFVDNNVKFKKGDLVSFTACVKQERRTINYIPTKKPAYTEYFYALTDFQQIQCANRVEYVSDIPNYLIEKGVKLYIVYNSFSKNYLINYNGKELTVPITTSFEDINNCLG